jgi:hypothetical protein
MAAARPFHHTWSSQAFGEHAELVHRKAAIALLKAQKRMSGAHVEGGLSTNHVYGNMFRSVYENLSKLFSEETRTVEEIMPVKVRGYKFLIVNGWLLYPIRYGEKLLPPQGAKVRQSKLRQAVLVELGPEPSQEPLGPEFDEFLGEVEPPSLPEVLAELQGNLKVAVIAFTSSIEAGIIQAFVGHPELKDDRLVWEGRIDPIDLTTPESGEAQEPGGSPVPFPPAPSGPRFGQGAEPAVEILPKSRPAAPPAEPDAPRPNIQNDE